MIASGAGAIGVVQLTPSIPAPAREPVPASGSTAILANAAGGVERTADRTVQRVTAAQSAIASATRLVIEKDAQSGVFVQRHIDAESGALMFQWPRDSWLVRKDAQDATGQMVDRTA
jgi:hypothetical protein